MYIKVANNTTVYPYSLANLRSDNVNVSFPSPVNDAVLADWNIYPVQPTERPEYNPHTQTLEEAVPENVGEVWRQVWRVTDASAEELLERQAARSEQVRQQRRMAYETEADPLFFKAQRGENTMEEWLAKVEEIKQRYPEV
jgi:hypothetical protein